MKKIFIFILMNVFAIGLVSCDDIITSGDLTTNPITEISTLEDEQGTTTQALDQTTDLTTSENVTTEISTDIEETSDVPTTTEDITTEENITTEEEITTVEVIDLEDSYYQYSTFSSQNIQILHLDVTDDVKVYSTEGVMIPNEDVLSKDNGVYEIKSSYILSHEGYEYVSFYLEFDYQRTLIQIVLNNKEIPYIISSTIVKTDGNSNLLFQFELFDGFIRQISSTDMEESDYEILENILTINQPYISEMFISNDNFLINYVLEDNQLVIGFMTIEKNN